MTDPHSHSDDEGHRGQHGHQHGRHGQTSCGCSGSGADPHSFSDHHTPGYAGSVERDGLYPVGVDVCSTGDWGRMYLSVGEVVEACVLDGGVVRVVVRIGGREKAVWGEVGGGRVDGLVGKRVLVLDNLEALRVGGEVFNGKVLTVDGSVVIVDAPVGVRVF